MIPKSHIAYADVQLSGSPKQACVSVIFRTEKEIDSLIDALQKLKQSTDRVAHCHLQHHDFPKGFEEGCSVNGSEVFFYSPNVLLNAEEMELREKLSEEYRTAVRHL